MVGIGVKAGEVSAVFERLKWRLVAASAPRVCTYSPTS